MEQNKEQRQFLRAYENIHLEFRVLSDSEEVDLFHKISVKNSFNETEAELGEIIRIINMHIENIKRTSPEIAACLSALDRKVDLLRQLKFPLQIDKVSKAANHHVNISAGGLSFLTNEKIETGKILELKITLLPGNQILDVYGTVVHTEFAEKEDHHTISSLIRVGVKFQHLTEAEQDIIVQYGLLRERERIQEVNNKTNE
ncbi:MAG: PilZ domain-containing protein [Gammaproteobacteria bacterium]|nr:PilZ domain-containing protein [Gammaproteobacteria bacterium]